MHFIGITGGVGAGKTAILSYLESNYPCRVMLADEIAHDVMEPGRDCYRKLQELFAKDQVFEADGQIDRKRMAQVLFSDEEKRLALNNIVHPAVKQYVIDEMNRERAAQKNKVLINFTPHLIPMNRGILVTAYASLTKDVSYEEVKAVYDKYYENETFVRVLDKDVCPQTKCVEGSNYVDVNFKIDPRTHRVIMMGAMDNLVKGAAGQAVQNMNLMFGFKEAEGLLQVPMCP